MAHKLFHLVFLRNGHQAKVAVTQDAQGMDESQHLTGPRLPFRSRDAAQRKRRRAYLLALDRQGNSEGWFGISDQGFQTLIQLTVEDCQPN
jgi:hypothetical protein